MRCPKVRDVCNILTKYIAVSPLKLERNGYCKIWSTVCMFLFTVCRLHCWECSWQHNSDIAQSTKQQSKLSVLLCVAVRAMCCNQMSDEKNKSTLNLWPNLRKLVLLPMIAELIFRNQISSPRFEWSAIAGCFFEVLWWALQVV